MFDKETQHNLEKAMDNMVDIIAENARAKRRAELEAEVARRRAQGERVFVDDYELAAWAKKYIPEVEGKLDEALAELRKVEQEKNALTQRVRNEINDYNKLVNKYNQLGGKLSKEQFEHLRAYLNGAAAINNALNARLAELSSISMMGVSAPWTGAPVDTPELPRTEISEAIAREIDAATKTGGAVRDALIGWLRDHLPSETALLGEAMDGQDVRKRIELLASRATLFARLDQWLAKNGGAFKSVSDALDAALKDEAFVRELADAPVTIPSPVVEMEGVVMRITRDHTGRTYLSAEKKPDGVTQLKPVGIDVPLDAGRFGIEVDENGQLHTTLAGLNGLAALFDAVQMRWFEQAGQVDESQDTDVFAPVAPYGEEGAKNAATKTQTEVAVAFRSLAVSWFDETLSRLMEAGLGREITRSWKEKQRPFRPVNAVMDFSPWSGKTRVVDENAIASHGIKDWRLVNLLHALRSMPMLESEDTAEMRRKIVENDRMPVAFKLIKSMDAIAKTVVRQAAISQKVKAVQVMNHGDLSSDFARDILNEDWEALDAHPDAPYLRALAVVYLMTGSGGADTAILMHGENAGNWITERDLKDGIGVAEDVGKRAWKLINMVGRDGFDVYHQTPRYLVDQLTAFFDQPPIDPDEAEKEAEKLTTAARAMLAGSARGIDPYEDPFKSNAEQADRKNVSPPYAISGENARLVGWHNLMMRAAWLKGYANAMRLTAPAEQRGVSQLAHHQAVLAGFDAAWEVNRRIQQELDEAIDFVERYQEEVGEVKRRHDVFERTEQAWSVLRETRFMGGRLINLGEREVNRQALNQAAHRLMVTRMGWNLRPNWTPHAGFQRLAIEAPTLNEGENDFQHAFAQAARAEMERQDVNELLPLAAVVPLQSRDEQGKVVPTRSFFPDSGGARTLYDVTTLKQLSSVGSRISIVPQDRNTALTENVLPALRAIASKEHAAAVDETLERLSGQDMLERMRWYLPAAVLVASRGEEWPVRWVEDLAAQARAHEQVRQALTQVDLENDGKVMPTVLETLVDGIRDITGIELDADNLDPVGTLERLANNLSAHANTLKVRVPEDLAKHVRLAGVQVAIERTLPLKIEAQEELSRHMARQMETDADRNPDYSIFETERHLSTPESASTPGGAILPGASGVFMRDHLGVLRRDNVESDTLWRMKDALGLDKAPKVAAGSLLSSANNTGDISTALFEPHAMAWRLSPRGLFNLIQNASRMDETARFWLMNEETDVIERIEKHAQTLNRLRLENAPEARIQNEKRRFQQALEQAVARAARMMGDYEIIQRRIGDLERVDTDDAHRLVRRLNELKAEAGLTIDVIQSVFDRLTVLGQATKDILGEDAPVINSPQDLSAMTLTGGAGIIEAPAELDDLMRTTGTSVITSPIHRAAQWRDVLTPEDFNGTSTNLPWSEYQNVLPLMEIRFQETDFIAKLDTIGFPWERNKGAVWKINSHPGRTRTNLLAQKGLIASNLREIHPHYSLGAYIRDKGFTAEWDNANSTRSTTRSLPLHGRAGPWIALMPEDDDLNNAQWPETWSLTAGHNGIDRNAAWYAFAAESFRTGARPLGLDVKTFMERMDDPKDATIWFSALNWLEYQRWADEHRSNAPLVDARALDRYNRMGAGVDTAHEAMTRWFGAAGVAQRLLANELGAAPKEGGKFGHRLYPKDIVKAHPFMQSPDDLDRALTEFARTHGDERFRPSDEMYDAEQAKRVYRSWKQ